jgi:hypothetical protein
MQGLKMLTETIFVIHAQSPGLGRLGKARPIRITKTALPSPLM